MAWLTAVHRSFLERKFGTRVSFDSEERKIYSQDIGEIPGAIKPLIGKAVSEAVVQPETEKDLVELTLWARRNRIPLTPRGKATSGCGGVIPVKKGVTVDFYRMNRIVSIDGSSATATVQAGVVWERLEAALGREGLMLRFYPTSAMASTVGGWLAQGGAGIGSFESGWFRDNVLSVRVVLPTGEVKDFSGTEIDLISDAEGITGMISEVTLRGRLIQEEGRMTFPPFEMMSAALGKEGNIWAGYRKNRIDWFPEDLIDTHGPSRKASTVYFAGCTASYVEQDIGIAAVRLLDEAGVDFCHLGNAENCCGAPMLVAGKLDVFMDTMRKNIELVKEAGADTVVSSCPACDMMWRNVYPVWAEKAGLEYGIKARHYSEVVAEKLESGEFRFPKN